MTSGLGPTDLGLFVLGYFLGTIPFGLLLTRFAGLGDIRNVGSGNIGATNVLRTGRKSLAAATLLGDALKGTLAVWIGWRLGMGDNGALAAALGAFLGHLFPVWLKFKGGKGVATFLGVLIGLNFWSALAFAAVWLGMAFTFRYSSLAALAAMAVTPVLLFFGFSWPGAALVMAILAALSWWKHKDNISRLLSGSESKIGQKNKASGA